MKLRFLKGISSEKKQGILFLALGLALFLALSLWRAHQAKILSFNTRQIPLSSGQSKGVLPVYIKIYPIGVHVSIKESAIIDGVWQISPDTASHLNVSAKIGGGGNIIIYGHNKDNILGPIRWIQKDAKIELIGQDSKSYFYSVEKTAVVAPDDIEYILPKDTELLTIYTCTGFLDSQRFVVVAKPI